MRADKLGPASSAPAWSAVWWRQARLTVVGTLVDLQAAIVDERERRGFTTDPVRLLVLLTEEVGELAREVKKTWSANYDTFDPGRLAPELADAFVLLVALASANDIDLETAVAEKFFGADGERSWRSAET